MSLPIAWIDKIFHKLSVAYGNEFMNRWKGIDINDVKSDWSDCLTGYQQNPQAIAFALENLPDSKAPTAQEFRAICRRVPASSAPQLPEPKAESVGRVDHKSWAKTILANDNAGFKLNPTTLLFAKQALKEAA
jgi:hypothetical protein